MEKKKGDILYQYHYDPVEMNIRQRAERQRKEKEKQKLQQNKRKAIEKKLAEDTGRKGR